MPALDLNFVRSNFPAFFEPSLEGFGFFENAGGSYACSQVTERLHRFYRQTKVQPYHDFAASAEAGAQMDSARRRWASCLNADTEEIHFGPSTSMNTYVLGRALAAQLRPGDEVVVTNQDHEANIGAWRRLEADGMIIREWQVDPATGELDPADLYALFSDRTRVVAFTHCSNIVGSIHPVRELTDRVHEAGAIAIVDGVSFCPHGLPDLRQLGADVYLFSLYKVYGPHLGVMYLREGLNAALPNQGHYFNTGISGARFTPAGPDHAQIAAANGVIDYMEAVYAHHHDSPAAPAEMAAAVANLFRQQEIELLQPLLDFLSGHPRVQLIGRARAEERAPTVSFTVRDMRSAELVSRLIERNLGPGLGHCYAYRLIEAMGIDIDDGVVRLSFVHYTTQEEVRQLIEALRELL
jgi:cysteine desulfurase family protein (TIGR01976 family)